MKKPTIAVVSFPGNNCEYESLRAIEQSDMQPLYFKWNDNREVLKNVDGYFLVGGFSYEDRGRSGMVAGRDSLMDFIGQEAEQGKVVIGNCNGAQILVESGLIPLDHGLRMSLARNSIHVNDEYRSPGFLSEWIWITPSGGQERCCTSHWQGSMHLPIAHGEGRFVSNDKDVVEELKRNKQLAFSYCTQNGVISEDSEVTPNGSMFGAAGICNPAGNVVALMPHPERTANGKPYFDSLREWIVRFGRSKRSLPTPSSKSAVQALSQRNGIGVEIFIDTIIVNNEERTVEQTARKFAPGLTLKQWKYFAADSLKPISVLSDLSTFNANKERAYIRRGNDYFRWNSGSKKEEPLSPKDVESLFAGQKLLRRDLPDTGGASLGTNGISGICYLCNNVRSDKLQSTALQEVFGNPHASDLRLLS